MRYIELIEEIIRPLGYQPEPENPKRVGTDADDSPLGALNKRALAHEGMPKWVPHLPGLHNLCKGRGWTNYEAVSPQRDEIWPASLTCPRRTVRRPVTSRPSRPWSRPELF
jgi:hypothetical protein